MNRRNYHTIRISTYDAIAKITLNQPERKNPISALTVHELLWALEDAKTDDTVRVVVLTGEGGTFSAGGDLKQMTTSEDTVAPKGDFSDLLLYFGKLGKPTVAQVAGAAMGGALGLLASCDFAVAAESATFGTPEIRRGLFPMMIMAVLARVISHRELMKLMLLGEKISAQEAKRIELLSHVVPDAELEASVLRLAQELAARSPTAMRMGLQAFHKQRDLALEQATPMLQQELFRLLGTEDAREGIAAFLERREPNWTGR